MMLQSLLYIVLATVIATLSLAGSLASLHTAALRAATVAVRGDGDAAVEYARTQLAAQMQQAVSEQIAFQPSPPGPYASGNHAFTATFAMPSTANGVEIRGTGFTGCTTAGQNGACNLEIGNGLAENRVQLIITTSTATGSSVAATDQRTVVYRVIDSPPYVLIAGERDANNPQAVMLGDTGGAPPQPGDSMVPDAANPQHFHDTRIHVYAPCRQVPAGAPVSPNEKKGWQDWQGDAPGPAHEELCDTGAGETSNYADEVSGARAPAPSGWQQ